MTRAAPASGVERSARARAALVACAALVALAAGCANLTGVAARGTALPLCLDAGTLAAEEDLPAPEIVPLLEEDDEDATPHAEAAPTAGAAGGGRPVRVGVRLGGVATLAEGDATWGSSGVLGVYCASSGRSGRRPGLELSLDLTGVAGDTGDGGAVWSAVAFLRGGALFGPWRPGAARRVAYVVAGAGCGFERSTWDLTGEIERRRAATLDVGVGLASALGVWDGRVAYSAFPGSGNARGALAVTVGRSF